MKKVISTSKQNILNYIQPILEQSPLSVIDNKAISLVQEYSQIDKDNKILLLNTIRSYQRNAPSSDTMIRTQSLYSELYDIFAFSMQPNEVVAIIKNLTAVNPDNIFKVFKTQPQLFSFDTLLNNTADNVPVDILQGDINDKYLLAHQISYFQNYLPDILPIIVEEDSLVSIPFDYEILSNTESVSYLAQWYSTQPVNTNYLSQAFQFPELISIDSLAAQAKLSLNNNQPTSTKKNSQGTLTTSWEHFNHLLTLNKPMDLIQAYKHLPPEYHLEGAKKLAELKKTKDTPTIFFNSIIDGEFLYPRSLATNKEFTSLEVFNSRPYTLAFFGTTSSKHEKMETIPGIFSCNLGNYSNLALCPEVLFQALTSPQALEHSIWKSPECVNLTLDDIQFDFVAGDIIHQNLKSLLDEVHTGNTFKFSSLSPQLTVLMYPFLSLELKQDTKNTYQFLEALHPFFNSIFSPLFQQFLTFIPHKFFTNSDLIPRTFQAINTSPSHFMTEQRCLFMRTHFLNELISDLSSGEISESLDHTFSYLFGFWNNARQMLAVPQDYSSNLQGLRLETQQLGYRGDNLLISNDKFLKLVSQYLQSPEGVAHISNPQNNNFFQQTTTFLVKEMQTQKQIQHIGKTFTFDDYKTIIKFHQSPSYDTFKDVFPHFWKEPQWKLNQEDMSLFSCVTNSSECFLPLMCSQPLSYIVKSPIFWKNSRFYVNSWKNLTISNNTTKPYFKNIHLSKEDIEYLFDNVGNHKTIYSCTDFYNLIPEKTNNVKFWIDEITLNLDVSNLTASVNFIRNKVPSHLLNSIEFMKELVNFPKLFSEDLLYKYDIDEKLLSSPEFLILFLDANPNYKGTFSFFTKDNYLSSRLFEMNNADIITYMEDFILKESTIHTDTIKKKTLKF